MQAAPRATLPASLECRAHGAVEATAVPALRELLRALDPRPPVPVFEQEVVLRGQPADGKGPGPELRLLRDIPPGAGSADAGSAGAGSSAGSSERADAEDSGSTWRVRHEGAVLRGKGVAELPASVRTVAESSCSGQAPLAFWGALGFGMRYGLAREGHRYVLEHAGHPLQVTLARVRRCGAAGPPGEEVAPGHWLLEVVARAAEGGHPAAALAIGSFGAQLEPPVDLDKA